MTRLDLSPVPVASKPMPRRSLLAGLLAAAAVLVAPASALAEEFTLKIATVAPDKTPWSELLRKYKKAVEEKSGGRIKVKIFLSGTLGDENETVLKCKRGQIQGVAASTGAVASQVPEVEVVEVPFLFKSGEQADKIIDTVLDAPMRKVFLDAGFVLGFWSENGFRHFGSKDTPIKSPADLKGKKMRSQESKVHLEMWRALGASPVPVPTTEVLPALQNGTVDGFDQALLFTIAANWSSSIKHYTLSGHIYQPALIAFNKAWYDKLPPDLQTMLVEEGKTLQDFGRKKVRGIRDKLIALMESQGVTVHKLTPAEKAAFERAAAPGRKVWRGKAKASAVQMLDMVERAK